MLRVGLTGGYATGKSFVAAEFERLGCRVIYADKLGHEVLLRSGEANIPVQVMFGSKVLSTNGDIDRKALAEIVFQNPDLLRRLTAIIHPAVYRLEQHLVEQYAKADPRAIIFTEAAILIETGRYKAFDRLVVTYCSEETQIARGMKRDHLTRQEILDRLARQMPAADKQRYANYVVNTDRQKNETVAQVRVIFEELRALASQ